MNPNPEAVEPIEPLDPEVRAALDAAGIGDIDPATGPYANPNYASDRYRVLEYFRLALPFNDGS